MRNDTSEPSRWRRKVLGIPVAWLVAIAGTALGVAGFLVILGTSGTLTAASGIDVTFNNHASNGGTPVTGTPTCTLTYVSPSEVNLAMSNAYPNDSCKFRVETKNTGAADAKLNGFKLAATEFTASVQTGADKECGDTLVAGTGVAFVDVLITAKTTLPPGHVYTFNPTLDGWDWRVPSLYQSGQCS